ncbi:hypothetical protein NU195Hw_g1129t1 [Hortaea werneckii]
MAELTPSNPSRVTPAQDLADTLAHQYTLYKQTKDRKYLDDMLEAVDSAVPDLKAGPHTMDDGLKAFFAFDDVAYSNGLGEEEIKSIKDELKKKTPTMTDLDTAVIQDVRRIVKDNDWSNRLPYSQVGFFLEACQECVRPESAEEVKTAEVDKVLKIVRISDKYV